MATQPSGGRGGGQAIAVCAVTTIGSSASEKILSDLPTLSASHLPHGQEAQQGVSELL